MSQNNYGKVAVLMGGLSGEREISLRSGAAVLQALHSANIDAHAIDVDRDVYSVLREQSFDRAFVALHGCGGEDGSMQGGLEVMGIPYTGSGVMASSICMDKLMTKRIWAAADVSSPQFISLEQHTAYEDVKLKLGSPFIVKPSLEGSSLGIHKVSDQDQYQVACQDAHKYKGKLLAEQWIDGGEYTVAVLNDTAMPIIRLETPRSFYDYEAKYNSNDTQYVIPCGLDSSTENNLQDLALAAFHAAGASGWGRVDLMMDQAGQHWFLEINTVPGMTDHSLVPMSAQHAGISFNQLVLKILDTSFVER